MTDIFAKKGYKLLCTYQDSFFVKEEYFHLFDIPEKDLIEYYLEGLEAHHRRMPWIQFILSQVGLKNRVIDLILAGSNYYNYGYDKRKIWAIEQKDPTLNNIQKLKERYNRKKEQR